MIIYLIYNIRYNNASHVYIQEFENMNILTYIYLRAAVGREGGGLEPPNPLETPWAGGGRRRGDGGWRKKTAAGAP
jgi:hypothetical protein